MPVYHYRCTTCGHEFDVTHSMNASGPDECPDCEAETVERVITSAAVITDGLLAHPGDGKRATQEQLRGKWAEETPRLRKKLRDKLGEDVVKRIPTLNIDSE